MCCAHNFLENQKISRLHFVWKRKNGENGDQYVIEKGANIEAKENNGWTPLHIACYQGHLPIVQYLIEKGANIEGKDKEQFTPLHIASLFGKIDVVKYLVSKGANKNAKNNWDGNCKSKNHGIACFFLMVSSFIRFFL